MLIVDNIGTVTCECSCNLFVPQSRVDARKYFSPHALYNVGVLYINYLTFFAARCYCMSAAYAAARCLSVRPSRSCILWKRIDVSSNFFHHPV